MNHPDGISLLQRAGPLHMIFSSVLQVVPPRNCEQYVGELQRIMQAHETHSNSRGDVRRKGWWDGEVREALDARRAANRQHRAAVTAALPINQC